MTPHITEFEGGRALSDFRTEQILPRLQAVHPKVNALSARFVHLVATDHALSGEERSRLAALLTYLVLANLVVVLPWSRRRQSPSAILRAE